MRLHGEDGHQAAAAHVLDEKLLFARTGRIWPYCGDKDHLVILYDYTATRGRAGPEEFLKGYSGFLRDSASCRGGDLRSTEMILHPMVAVKQERSVHAHKPDP